MFFIFTIPSALFFFLYGLLVVFGMGAIQGVQDFFTLLKENYWIIITITIISLIFIVYFLAKKKGYLYTMSTLVSASHIVFLFLALLYDMIGVSDVGDMIGYLLIVVPIVGIVMALSFCGVMKISCEVDGGGKGYYKFYLIAIAGWIVTYLLCF